MRIVGEDVSTEEKTYLKLSRMNRSSKQLVGKSLPVTWLHLYLFIYNNKRDDDKSPSNLTAWHSVSSHIT